MFGFSFLPKTGLLWYVYVAFSASGVSACLYMVISLRGFCDSQTIWLWCCWGTYEDT